MAILRSIIKTLIPASIRDYRWVIREKRRSLVRNWKANYRRIAGPMPLDDYDDYDDYWRKRGYLERIPLRWLITRDYLKQNAISTLFDVGCGSGEFLKYISNELPLIKCEGGDLSSEAVEKTHALGFPAKVLKIDKGSLRDKYDCVTCFEVLEHIGEAEAALKNLSSMFSKYLIISVPNIGFWGCRLRLAMGRFPNTICVMHIKEHLRHWTVRDFNEWILFHGLKVVYTAGWNGVRLTPFKRFPRFFASGVVYVIEHDKS